MNALHTDLDEVCFDCFGQIRSWEVFCSQCGTISPTFASLLPCAGSGSDNQGIQDVNSTPLVTEQALTDV